MRAGTPGAEEGTAAEYASAGRRTPLPDELTEFLTLISRELAPERMDIRADKVYYMPEDLPLLNGVRFLRTGLLLGEPKKNDSSPARRWP